MTMLNRSAQNASPEFVLTKAEIQLLDRLVENKTPVSTNERHCRIISSRSPGSAAISPAPTIRHQGL
ncbi:MULTISPECIES: hypothetical protein [Bradyrhizobium]|nr:MULTISPECIES: hypothetical protein [Bradyrhizobium]